MTGRQDDALLDWLQSDDVIAPDGAVMSWHNPAKPGYPYPEISGLLLSLLARYGSESAGVRSRVVENLERTIGDRDAVGRGGVEYVFDTAMVLSGLIAHAEAGGVSSDALAHRLFQFIVGTLAQRKGIRGPVPGDVGHWSNSYGCHLLKTGIAITTYCERSGASDAEAPAHRIVDQLLGDLLPLYSDGRFKSNHAGTGSYVHAHCYATEGLLFLSDHGLADASPEINGSARWLADIQDESGGIRAWHDGVAPSGPLRTDASSQAIRIWCLVDRDGFQENIRRGLEFLSGVRHPSGGLRYEPASDDMSTWSTIFAYQATRWTAESGHPTSLI